GRRAAAAGRRSALSARAAAAGARRSGRRRGPAADGRRRRGALPRRDLRADPPPGDARPRPRPRGPRGEPPDDERAPHPRGHRARVLPGGPVRHPLRGRSQPRLTRAAARLRTRASPTQTPPMPADSLPVVHLIREAPVSGLEPDVAASVFFESLNGPGGVPETKDEVVLMVRGPLCSALNARVGSEESNEVVDRILATLAPGGRRGREEDATVAMRREDKPV